jgi:hypothetical protein
MKAGRLGSRRDLAAGILYDVSVPWLILFSAVMQLASIPFFILIKIAKMIFVYREG